MRRFTDEEGRAWEVVAGRESWGSIVAIFIPGEGPVRQAPLHAQGYEQANEELSHMPDENLRTLLGRSTVKEIG